LIRFSFLLFPTHDRQVEVGDTEKEMGLFSWRLLPSN
jgi:hypothetical protein